MFSVTILGSNSALPQHGRHPSAQIVQVANEYLLIDCGEGTQMQMNKYHIKRHKINHIFISHLHGDHYYGLIGLLNSFALTGRKEDLYLYAPKALFPILNQQIELAQSQLPFTLKTIALEENSTLLSNTAFSVSSFAVEHRIPCWGFLIKTFYPKRNIQKEAILQYDIPHHAFALLQNGESIILPDGRLLPNESVTVAGKPSQTYAYCADTRFTLSFLDSIMGADLLYHEATYLDNMSEKAYSRYHATSVQAATIAKNAQAKQLLLGHFSSQYADLQPFLNEAQAIFPNTALAIEGTTYVVK